MRTMQLLDDLVPGREPGGGSIYVDKDGRFCASA